MKGREHREKREKRSTENRKCKKRHKIKNVLEFKFALAPVSIPLLPHSPAPGSSCSPKPNYGCFPSISLKSNTDML